MALPITPLIPVGSFPLQRSALFPRTSPFSEITCCSCSFKTLSVSSSDRFSEACVPSDTAVQSSSVFFVSTGLSFHKSFNAISTIATTINAATIISTTVPAFPFFCFGASVFSTCFCGFGAFGAFCFFALSSLFCSFWGLGVTAGIGVASRVAVGTTTGAPQLMQNLCPSFISAPHFEQNIFILPVLLFFCRGFPLHICYICRNILRRL